jgi:hypothetical protein
MMLLHRTCFRVNCSSNRCTGMSSIDNIETQHEREVTAGRRFRFGRNWVFF